MNLRKLPVLIVPLLISVGQVAAQEVPPTIAATPAPEPTAIKLKPGTLASSGRYMMRGEAVPQVPDGTIPGERSIAIGASIKRLSSTRCSAVVTNSDEKLPYAVSFEVKKSIRQQSGGGGGSSKSYSATVPPKGSTERDFACEPGDNFEVVLKSGHSLKAK